MNTKKTSRDYLVQTAITLLVMWITSATAWAANVNYINVDGTTGTANANMITINSSTALGEGWYVVDNDIEGPLTFNGNVNLIIIDNKNVTITGPNGIIVNGNLTIYGQSQGTGSLTITATSSADINGYGIYAKNGEITINGGTLNISATRYGICTYGESTNDCHITINGGRITANGNENGIDAWLGNITLGYTNPTDYIFANRYGVTENYTISIASGKTIINGNEALRGTISSSNIDKINNMILAPDLFGISAGHDGSIGNPYTISSAGGLQLLATYVNSGTICVEYNESTKVYDVYNGVHFKINCDIAFTSTFESNFIPIGGKPTSKKYAFCGTFDGEGHTISGINILYTDKRYVGLFGLLGEGSTVKNVTLDYANISGYDFTGGIAGYNDKGNITNCLVTNTTISGLNAGAIIGGNSGTLKYNYYNNCSVNNNATNVGCHGGDIDTMDGAKLATILSESESVPTPLSGKVVFRREFTGGSPSTICLPFDYTPEASDGTFYTFTGVEKVEGKWEATMNKVDGALTANTPYIIVPDENRSIVPVLFHGDAKYASDPSTQNGNWTFVGTYDVIEWKSAPTMPTYGFSAQAVADDGIYQGQFVKVGKYVKIRSLRAYLQYGSTNTRSSLSEEELPDRILVRLVGSGETSIGQLDLNTGEVTFDDGWYTLDGIRLNGKPTKQGIYVNKGKKYIIK